MLGVGEDADQAVYDDVEASLLPDLAEHRLGDGLAKLVAPARECVEVVAGAADHQEPAGVVQDEGTDVVTMLLGLGALGSW